MRSDLDVFLKSETGPRSLTPETRVSSTAPSVQPTLQQERREVKGTGGDRWGQELSDCSVMFVSRWSCCPDISSGLPESRQFPSASQ